MSSLSSIKRRQILSGLVKLLFFIGFIFLSIPFMSSFTTSEIDEKQNAKSHWVITFPVTELVESEVKKLSWAGGLVWVYARTEKDIELLKTNKTYLTDRDSDNSFQPENMKSSFRSANEKYFIFIPQENKRNCQVRLKDEREKAIFTEPCFSAEYDAAGRILQGTGHKAQTNLSVPKHVIENEILKIGIWTPK